MPIDLIRSDSLIGAATAVHRRLAERVEREREKEAKAKADAAAAKSLLGDSHWHDRHRAEARLTAGRAVETAIAEILDQTGDPR